MGLNLSKLFDWLKRGPGKDFLGEYRILGEPIADGPMSVVFRAVGLPMGSAETADRLVAIKVLKDSAARMARRLQTELGMPWEGERATQLLHPNVVRTIRCGCESGTFYMVMEFIGGAPLSSLIYEGSPLLDGRRIAIIRQIAQGLAYIHGSGIIHRDICPKNVLVDSTGHAKLIDFGVAISAGYRLQDTGRRTGRPSYMAPELIRDNVFDVRTDIYALGVSMYELSTGAKPLAGADRYEKMRLHLFSSPNPPADVNRRVPPALSELIVRCLVKDPGRRVQSADDLLRELPNERY